MGLVVTTTANIFKVVTNEYSTLFGYTEITFQKSGIGFGLDVTTPVVEVFIGLSSQYSVSLDGNANSMIVDSVNGVVPVTLEGLYLSLVTSLG